jgi:ribosomal protein L37AE/L43A
MEDFLDGMTIDFPCLECGKEISEAICRLKDEVYRCPHCGAVMDSNNLADILREYDDGLDDALGNIGEVS